MTTARNSEPEPAIALPAGGLTSSVRLLIIGLTAFLTVVDLFATQALLPALTAHYGVKPSAMSLAVNACTLGMAAGSLAVALLSQTIDRRHGIVASLLLLSLPTMLLAFAPSIWVFAVLRVAQGLFMASAFGLTLAYLGDEYSAQQSSSAFAAYITGNVASNLIGRLIATATVEHAGLAANFFMFAILNIAGAILAFATVRSMKQPAPANTGGMPMTGAWSQHLHVRELRAAFGVGFCILFAFIGTFTYVNFVLVSPPLSVGMMTLGVIYFVFLPSIVTTLLAGTVAKRTGFRQALWGGLGVAALGLPMLAVPSLPVVLIGMVLVAAGTFFAQALATGFVSRTAKDNRAAASGLYLASYFTGGLAGTAVLGQIFDHFGWTATVIAIGVVLAIAAVLTIRLVSPAVEAR